MSEEYDLVIIGAGSAGLPAAGLAHELGARVVLVEAARIGGDCTWTGCVPSKALLQAARVAHLTRTADRYGIPAREPVVDLAAVMSEVKAAVARVYESESVERLRAAGLEVVLGPARFLDPHTIEAGGRRLRGRHFLVCTGAEPEIPAVDGLEVTPHLTYLDIYDLSSLPGRLAVLGSGPVGCELAQAFCRLGSKVTLLESADRLLPIAPPEVGDILVEAFEEEGMEVQTAVDVRAVRRAADGVVLSTTGGELAADRLLVAGGRRPRTARLDLDLAGVRLAGGAIEVDGSLRTSQPHIYAAGDVTGSFQFTHYAGWQGFQAARNALLPGSSGGLRETVPWAVFTDPEVAQVGSQTGELHEWPLARHDRAQAAGLRRGLVRVYSDQQGHVTGAVICLEAAAELVNELAVAIEARLKLKDLASVIHVYPSFGFPLQQLAAEASVRGSLGGLRGRLLKTLIR